MLSRRSMLRGLAAGGLAAGLPWASRAVARPWATPPTAAGSGLLLPPGARAERVLEVFLYGGLSPFDSFYVVPGYGAPTDPTFPNEQSWLFRDAMIERLGVCGLADTTVPFATDSLGQMVHFGPLLAPLTARSDIMDRTRVLVMRHSFEPHEAAIPLALSGFPLGSTRMAGIGTSVQRWHLDRDTTGRRVPYSYVLFPDTELSTDNLRAASSVGLNTGAARPLDLRISDRPEFRRQLDRKVLGDRRDRHDTLLAYYAAQARRRYADPTGPLRARSLDDHAYSVAALADADALTAVLPRSATQAVAGRACDASAPAYPTAMGLKLAAHLLTDPRAPARHVTVVDGGLEPAAGGGGYDVHEDHVRSTSMNLTAMLEALVSHIAEPGDDDPDKIRLDDTMIVLNTEFGRTPFLQQGSAQGTNHHPYGYVTVMIGGPARRGVLGAIGPDGWADRYITPVEGRAAVLAAMGIWPFTQESYAIGDLRDLLEEPDGLAWLDEIVLGRRS